MSKLRVCITSSDREGCGFYRVRGPAQALADQGEIELIDYPQIQLDARHRGDGSAEINGIVDPPDADVVVFQRIAERHIADSIPYFQKLGIAVCVDIDDHLRHLPAWHSQFEFYSPRNIHYNYRHFQRACKQADLVTYSTPTLSVYAPYKRGMLVRNRVPASYLDITAERDGQTVGWGGAVAVHQGDLDVTRGGVGEAVLECGAKFRVVGLPDHVQQKIGLAEEPESTGLIPFDQYPHEVAKFDVGIAPLHDGVFNAGKSNLKGLEYASLGVAWVGSPLPEYLWLQKKIKVGQIAKDRSRDWSRAIKRLLTDDAYREEESVTGRVNVRLEMLLESNAWRWAEAWETAVENLRS